MPILTNLNQSITTLEGTPVADILKDRTMTYRSALITVCEMHRPLTPGTGESLKAFDLGMKILKAENSIEFEESDLDFLKKIVQESSVFLSVIIGRLVHFLEMEKLEESKVEKKT